LDSTCRHWIRSGRGERGSRRFREFFTAFIRKPDTRLAYLAAAGTGAQRRGRLFRSYEEIAPLVPDCWTVRQPRDDTASLSRFRDWRKEDPP